MVILTSETIGDIPYDMVTFASCKFYSRQGPASTNTKTSAVVRFPTETFKHHAITCECRLNM